MRISDLKRSLPMSSTIVITAACLFGSAGKLGWAHAWVLLGITFVSGLAFTFSVDPELARERRNVKAGKDWDKVLVGITVLLGPMAVWITAGLDERFHWSDEVPFWVRMAAVTAALLAPVLIIWSMRTNRFFSSVVRIQRDRGHVVIDGGPYRYIRHPGYAGMALFTLVTPLILGSYRALVPAAATVAVVVLRTSMEDSTLHQELDGYADYAHRVRYKLLPAVW